MAGLWDNDQRARVAAALDAVVPGASDLGGVDYVEGLLCAFDHDPPRIWASPGHAVGGGGWLELGPWEQHAWRTRIAAWRDVYDRVLDGVSNETDVDELHRHACEATYGDPAYGGNRDGQGWVHIGFPEPLFPPSRSSAS